MGKQIIYIYIYTFLSKSFLDCLAERNDIIIREVENVLTGFGGDGQRKRMLYIEDWQEKFLSDRGRGKADVEGLRG